ncbi:MAG TPA: DUF362 domain-containing protein [Bryobacteraceae bacterium]|nr:DUF362 domain-containing protein [Bryobacteraceae bacterium]
MTLALSRRELFQAGAASLSLAMAARRAAAQSPAPLPPPLVPNDTRAAVSLMKGEDRRRNVYNALMAIDHQIAPALKHKKYVVIKPNNVSTVRQLASTHPDAVRGMLDYLSERFHGPVMISEASAGETMEGFETFHYPQVAREYKRVSLLDLNAEAKYQVLPVLDFDLHLTPVRLAARLLDPEAFVMCSAILKTHNTVVATLSVKNMCLGAPLHNAPKEKPEWNDKRRYHGGVRQTHYDMFLTAQKLRPFWGATVIDGYEGMEGNGPSAGTPVPSRVAIASMDYIAADRVGVEAMGVRAENIGYLLYCWQAGLGQYDLNRIDIIGENLASVRRTYRQHNDIDRELQWMGPMLDLPPKLG